MAPGRFKVNFRWVNFKLILVVNGWGISRETALTWMSLDHIYGKSTLVQVMAWCRQATSHYLSQWWPRSLSLYGITRTQWVKKKTKETVEATSAATTVWTGMSTICLNSIVGKKVTGKKRNGKKETGKKIAGKKVIGQKVAENLRKEKQEKKQQDRKKQEKSYREQEKR